MKRGVAPQKCQGEKSRTITGGSQEKAAMMLMSISFKMWSLKMIGICFIAVPSPLIALPFSHDLFKGQHCFSELGIDIMQLN